MARYVVTVRTPKSVEESFAYMADLTNFARWDPGVISSTQVEGDGSEPEAAFDVEVKGIPRPITLRYRLSTFEPPNLCIAEARSSLLTSVDTITVRRDDADGSLVTYDAKLTLNGVLGLADPLLARAFDGIGDRAARGLVHALEGSRMEDTT